MLSQAKEESWDRDRKCLWVRLCLFPGLWEWRTEGNWQGMGKEGAQHVSPEEAVQAQESHIWPRYLGMC